MIDIIFIHPNASQKIYQGLSKSLSAIEPPIWAGLLAGHCLKNGFSVNLLDCEAEQINIDQAADIINSVNPRIACFCVYGQQPSASTQNMEGAVELSSLLNKKYPHIKILFVGAHVAAAPVITMALHPEIDFVCQNEGVYTILKLLKTDMNSEHDLSLVDGLGYRMGDLVFRNRPSDVVPQRKMQDDLPGVAWELFTMKKYRTSLWHSYTNDCCRGDFASIYTSLGCPFGCYFCMINIINRTNGIYANESRMLRRWPVSSVMDQLDKLADMGMKNLKIADEMFVLNPNHFLEICKQIIRRKHKFNIWCYARIDTVKREYLDIMKKAGINWIGLGIESGAQKVRDDVIKGQFERVDIRQVVKDIDNSGINVAANYIFGLPEDDISSMQDTLDLAFELNTPMANFYSAMAYPGSPLYGKALENGWELPGSYLGYSQHSYECQPLPTKYVSAREVLKFRDDAWKKYHNRSKYLDLIKNKFGDKAKEETINSMNIKLKRKLLND